MKRGLFIVIEGVDGSGKTTQFELLSGRLKRNTKKVVTADFPRYYDSVWGKMVGDFLKGKYGDFDKTNPYLVVLPYMLDQYTWSRDIGKKMIENGKIILSNRYFTSNNHQIAKLKGVEREKYRKWIWPTGYKQLGILEPDLVLFLDVDPKIAFKLNKTKKNRKYLNGKSEDEAEKRLYHQKAAYKEYKKTAKQFKYWRVIRCITKGKIDSPEVIHDRIWKEVSKFV
jgi:dTMP kinase